MNRHRDGLARSVRRATETKGDRKSRIRASRNGALRPSFFPSSSDNANFSDERLQEAEAGSYRTMPADGVHDDAKELAAAVPEHLEFEQSIGLISEESKHSNYAPAAQEGWTKNFVRRRIVEHPQFEYVVAFLVLVNSLVVGWKTQFMFDEKSHWDEVMEWFEDGFCLAFAAEMWCRIYAVGFSVFFSISATNSWKWNLFDSTVVGLQVMERIVQAIHELMHLRPPPIKVVRALRIVRIIRLVRIVRVFEELHTITSSIVTSMMSLFWTLFLLFLTLYIFSILFAQTVASSIEARDNEALMYWFGGLARTMLTMFEVVTSGVSWDEVADPIIEHLSPGMGGMLVLYITFCHFVMLNMATGVFVEAAVRKSKEDSEVFAANHISEIFFGDGQKPEVDWDTFHQKLTMPDMQDYFKSINVDPSEARGLFHLIDVDGGGTIDANELINGLLRLRGQATALDLSMLMYEVCHMNKVNVAYQSRMEDAMGIVFQALGNLSSTMKCSNELVDDIAMGQEMMFAAQSNVVGVFSEPSEVSSGAGLFSSLLRKGGHYERHRSGGSLFPTGIRDSSKVSLEKTTSVP